MRVALAVALLVECIGCGRAHFDTQADGGADLLTYREAVLADGPVAYYRLSDPGTTALDDMQHFDGTYDGPCTRDIPGLLVGDPDGALELDGQCAIDLGDVLAFTDRQPFTIEAWFVKAAGGGNFQHIVARETRNTNPVDGYSMLVSTQTGLYAERSVATNNTTTNRVPITNDTVYHAVTVYTGSEIDLYVDGTLMASGTDMRALGAFTTKSVIGAVTDPTFNSYFIGKLDEVAIYDQALPLERIQLHHEIGITGPIGQ